MQYQAVCHVHSEWSYDASWSLEALSAKFSRQGCRVLMMTEHDLGFSQARFAQYRRACQQASSEKILVVPGIEYSDSSNQVHVLVWGNIPFLGEGLPTAEMLEKVRAAGGVAVLAHPHRKNVWRIFDSKWSPLLPGVEVWNRKYDGWADSKVAPELLAACSAMPFVGLDFHSARQSFPLTMALEIDSEISEESVVECLRSRNCSPRAFGYPLDHPLVRVSMPLLTAAELFRHNAAAAVRRLRKSFKVKRTQAKNPAPVVKPSRTASGARQISICVCTFKRMQLLKQLLEGLTCQETEGRFTYSVVVADNDKLRSAEQVVAELSASSNTEFTYCVEPTQNIAMVRNQAVQHAKGDLIAFIDDDEYPTSDWLLKLFKTFLDSGAAGVLGPVKPHFQTEPPSWAIEGKFFERPSYPTGTIIRWNESRTGNVLFDRSILTDGEPPFRPEFDAAGEDIDFFRRMAEKGHTFVWCNEAVVFEAVPSARCNRTYLLKRALIRGSNFSKHPKHRVKNGMKSIVAVPCYTLALPFVALLGQSVFLKYLIRLLDHGSRLLAFAGLKMTTGRQI